MKKINFVNGQAPYINDTNLNQLQDNVEEVAEQKITTGEEIATNEYIDGKQVFRKRIDFGALPNATTKTISSELNVDEITLVRTYGIAYGYASDTYYAITLPDISPLDTASATRLTFSSTDNILNVIITTGTNRSNYNAYVDLYYTKNN